MTEENRNLFKEAFDGMSTIHKFDGDTPETFGFSIENLKVDKRSQTPESDGRIVYYLVGTAHYPPEDRQIHEIIYPFSSMDTKLRKMFGEIESLSLFDDKDHIVPDCIGKNILIKYEGKKPNPVKGRKDYHSCFIDELK